MSKKNSKKQAFFRDSNGRFKKGCHWRPHAAFRERDYLIREYVKRKRSTGEIAKTHGVTDAAIIFWLKKHKIPRRSTSEARIIKHWGPAGEKNPQFGKFGNQSSNWIDGTSPLRQRMYSRFFWKELVKEVKRRDKYRCRRCGRKTKLQTHHIKSWARCPKSRFKLSNIISLCGRCHRWVHSKRNINSEYLSYR